MLIGFTCLDLEVFVRQREHNGVMEGSNTLSLAEILRHRVATFGMLNDSRAGLIELNSFGRVLPREVHSLEAAGELLALLLEVLKIQVALTHIFRVLIFAKIIKFNVVQR